MTIFLDRSVKPYDGNFDVLNRYWSDPAYRAAVDAKRDEERRAKYNEWSAEFDRLHPFRTQEIAAAKQISKAMGGGLVSRSLTK